MDWQPGDKIKSLTPYEPIQGSYKIRLDANESGCNLPSTITAEIAQEITTLDFNRYPDPYAVQVCTAFAKRYCVDPALVTAGNGSDELISIIVGSLLSGTDKLIFTAPDFSMYKFYAHMFERQSVVIPKNDSMQVEVDTLLAAVQDHHPAALILSNPCNPTGQIIPRSEMLRLIEGAECLVILDEAYMDFADQSVLDRAEDYENLIVLRTCSKAVGMAAIRLGFAIAGPAITRMLQAAKSPYNVNAMSQSAGRCILAYGDYLDRCVQNIVEQRRWLEGELNRLQAAFPVITQVYPSSTNAVLIKTTQSSYIYEQLLTHSIVIRQMEDCLRITAGTPAECTALVTALEEILIKK